MYCTAAASRETARCTARSVGTSKCSTNRTRLRKAASGSLSRLPRVQATYMHEPMIGPLVTQHRRTTRARRTTCIYTSVSHTGVSGQSCDGTLASLPSRAVARGYRRCCALVAGAHRGEAGGHHRSCARVDLQKPGQVVEEEMRADRCGCAQDTEAAHLLLTPHSWRGSGREECAAQCSRTDTRPGLRPGGTG